MNLRSTWSMPGSSPPGQSSHDPVHPQKRHPHPRSRSRCPRCLQRHRTPAGHGVDSRGLSSGALEILIRLSAATDGGISIGDLAKAAGVSSSNVIALVDTLQPDGLAQRVPDRRARSRRPPTDQPGKGPGWFSAAMEVTTTVVPGSDGMGWPRTCCIHASHGRRSAGSSGFTPHRSMNSAGRAAPGISSLSSSPSRRVSAERQLRRSVGWSHV